MTFLLPLRHGSRTLLSACAAALLLCSLAAHAGDSTAPVITHTPPHAGAGKTIRVTAHIVDESRIFPQLYFRYGTAPFEAPVDMKKVKGGLDDYEATIPNKPGPIDYYLECYDEFGNGPARAGAPDAPLRVIAEEASAVAEKKDAEKVEAEKKDAEKKDVAAAASTLAPLSASDFAISPATSTPAEKAAPVAQAAAMDQAAHAPSSPGPHRLSLDAHEPARLAVSFTAPEAAWHSALLPGWGQIRSKREIRGAAFAVATGASLVATLWLTVRAHQANTIYVNAPLSVRSQAFDQANDYATARNTMLGVTIGVWALNVAEAYFLHHDNAPWASP